MSDNTNDIRRLHAKAHKTNGRRAYSDAHGHVLVRMAGAEHGLDLVDAVRLRTDLDKAIQNAALSDEDYLNLCG